MLGKISFNLTAGFKLTNGSSFEEVGNILQCFTASHLYLDEYNTLKAIDNVTQLNYEPCQLIGVDYGYVMIESKGQRRKLHVFSKALMEYLTDIDFSSELLESTDSSDSWEGAEGIEGTVNSSIPDLAIPFTEFQGFNEEDNKFLSTTEIKYKSFVDEEENIIHELKDQEYNNIIEEDNDIIEEELEEDIIEEEPEEDIIEQEPEEDIVEGDNDIIEQESEEDTIQEQELHQIQVEMQKIREEIIEMQAEVDYLQDKKDKDLQETKSFPSYSISPHSISPHSISPHSISPHSISPHSISPHSIHKVSFRMFLKKYEDMQSIYLNEKTIRLLDDSNNIDLRETIEISFTSFLEGQGYLDPLVKIDFYENVFAEVVIETYEPLSDDVIIYIEDNARLDLLDNDIIFFVCKD
jgi:hypothetical protein